VPDGLLHYENNIIFRLYPLHLGMRWYWRDFGSMERWTRSEPHRQWWQRFMRDSGGTGFWHEVYLMRGGMEGVYAALSHYRKLHAMDISLRDIMPRRRLRAMSASPRPERLDAFLPM
jgi:Domain of unknown function (DUF4188)